MLNWVFTFKVRLSCITLDYGEVLWSCAWIQGQFACVHAMSWQIYLLMVPSKQDQCEESRKKFLKWIDVHFPPDEKSFFPKRTSVESLKFCIKFDFFECFSFQAFFLSYHYVLTWGTTQHHPPWRLPQLACCDLGCCLGIAVVAVKVSWNQILSRITNVSDDSGSRCCVFPPCFVLKSFKLFMPRISSTLCAAWSC